MSKATEKLNIDNAREKEKYQKLIEEKTKQIQKQYQHKNSSLEQTFNTSSLSFFDQSQIQKSGAMSKSQFQTQKNLHQEKQVIISEQSKPPQSKLSKFAAKKNLSQNKKAVLSFEDQHDEEEVIVKK